MSDLLGAMQASAKLQRQDPCAGLLWSPWQEAFLRDASLRRVARTSNQIGKTEVITADMVMEVRGRNPFRPRRHVGPITVMFVGESIEQMSRAGGPLEKLWAKIPQHEVMDGVYFERGVGIRGLKNPAIPFVRGPGAGSVIQIGTYKQNPQALAGFTGHEVYCDEPCYERIYAELLPRVLANRGGVTISFTPTLSMPSQGWLKQLVEDGVFSEHYADMRPENAHPRGFARPFLDQAQIDEFEKSLPEIERGMRLRAHWEAVVTGRWLTFFDSGSVVEFSLADVPTGTWLGVGIDHGRKAGKQTAVLGAIADRTSDHPRAWMIDERQGDGRTTPEQDAEDILKMLAENGLKYSDVDSWVGDRSTSEEAIWKRKSNARLRRALADVLGVRYEDTAWIHTPHKYAGSVIHGLRVMNAMLGRKELMIHPRCKRLIAGAQGFRGSADDPHKDILDAGRYLLEHGIESDVIGNVRVRTR